MVTTAAAMCYRYLGLEQSAVYIKQSLNRHPDLVQGRVNELCTPVLLTAVLF